jgi:hypothetical protein
MNVSQAVQQNIMAYDALRDLGVLGAAKKLNLSVPELVHRAISIEFFKVMSKNFHVSIKS